MKPLTLVTLRCPRRCLLGLVVATGDGPQIVMRERALVQTGLEETRHERQTLGPFPLEDPHVTYGCRHSAGEVITPEQATALRRVVADVQSGATRPGIDHMLESAL